MNNMEIAKLEEALLQAGRAIGPALPRGAWRADVMRAIRQIGPFSAAEEAYSFMSGLIWKVALPAAACALVLCIAVQIWGIAEHYAAQRVEMNNTIEYALASRF